MRKSLTVLDGEKVNTKYPWLTVAAVAVKVAIVAPCPSTTVKESPALAGADQYRNDN
jgi:hypothetical protein